MARADRRSVRSARPHAAQPRKRDSDLVAHRGHAVLHAAAPPREVDVRLPRARLRRRLRRLRHRREPERDARRPPPRQRRRDRAATSRSPTRASRWRRTRRAPRPSATSRPRCRRTARPTRRSSCSTGYVELRPKDADALRELAGLHLGRANALAQEAQDRSAARELSHASARPSPARSTSAMAPRSAPTRSTRRSRRRPRRRSATRTRRRRRRSRTRSRRTTSSSPSPRRDPNVQLELAQAAQQSGDYAKAIAAYERFLKLAPDDPSAPIVKQQIAQLKAAQAPAPSG